MNDLQRLIQDDETIRRVIQSSYTFKDALSKLGVSMDHYSDIREFASDNHIKTKEQDDITP